jgi:formate hydrogenlyase subunit 5
MESTVNTAASTQSRTTSARLADLAAGAETFMREGVPVTLLDCTPDELRNVCERLTCGLGFRFATLVVEEAQSDWRLAYVFYGKAGDGLIHVTVRTSGPQPQIPSISALVHAADWHERETEDLFGVGFEGHPKLGDFVLHEHWPEGLNPMRSNFNAAKRLIHGELCPWQPERIVQAPGAFVMPIGPVYSDFAESAHFLLETVGEDVIRVIPRFFYKYRGVEKLAEGRTVDDVLLLAERFTGTSAFAHSLAFCQAVEAVCNVVVPPRADALRSLLAEVERFRHHAAVIAEICGSTALAVATSQAAILEEELLRVCCKHTGHRYMFGINVPGGVSIDLPDEACGQLGMELRSVLKRLDDLQEMLRFTSSFLDRIEEVGAIPREKAVEYGLVGPIARASGLERDLRVALPYAFYGDELASFTVPLEVEGDGYARLRVLFREAEQSARIVERLAGSLPPGEIRCLPFGVLPGAALGWAEAPFGAAFHWVRIGDDGRVARYRITPPSFTNWHGFHLAAEDFAFQDFPIIMATFGLSNAECDR